MSISSGHQHEHSMIRCLALLEHDLVSLCQKSPACFLIKFPARYVSCACGPLHTTPIPHSFPSPYPPLPSLRRCLGRRRNPHPRTQSGESPPGVCVSSPLFHQSAQDSADRGLALIDLVAVSCCWSGWIPGPGAVSPPPTDSVASLRNPTRLVRFPSIGS